MSTLKHRTSAAPEADMSTPRTLVVPASLGLRRALGLPGLPTARC